MARKKKTEGTTGDGVLVITPISNQSTVKILSPGQFLER